MERLEPSSQHTSLTVAFQGWQPPSHESLRGGVSPSTRCEVARSLLSVGTATGWRPQTQQGRPRRDGLPKLRSTETSAETQDGALIYEPKRQKEKKQIHRALKLPCQPNSPSWESCHSSVAAAYKQTEQTLLQRKSTYTPALRPRSFQDRGYR